MLRLVANRFDSEHNTFETVRRGADIWEWGNRVLWPGLFADIGPCSTSVGLQASTKDCNDEVWPDGDGRFSLTGATPLPISELLEQTDMFDWTGPYGGLTIRLTRAKVEECETTRQLGVCYSELTAMDQVMSVCGTVMLHSQTSHPRPAA